MYACEWFHPEASTSWRDTYVVSVKQALSSFGTELHAGQVKISLKSVRKGGNEHQMAVSNNKAFMARCKAAADAKEAAKKAADNQAAATLTALPEATT